MDWADWSQIFWPQFLINYWTDWAKILLVSSLGYLIVPYLLTFYVTAPKRLHLLNSNLLTTIPHKSLNGLSWYFVSMFLRYLIVPYLLRFCITAPKRLRLLNSNLLTTIPHKPLNGLSWNFLGRFLRIPYFALST